MDGLAKKRAQLDAECTEDEVEQEAAGRPPGRQEKACRPGRKSLQAQPSLKSRRLGRPGPAYA